MRSVGMLQGAVSEIFFKKMCRLSSVSAATISIQIMIRNPKRLSFWAACEHNLL